MENAKPQRNYGLSCLLERDDASGVYTGHCLDYDLMECGKDFDEAWRNLKIAVKNHIEYCYAGWRDGLKSQARPERWERYFEILAADPSALKIEKIEIQIEEPLPQAEIPIWIQAAEVSHGREHTVREPAQACSLV